MGRKVFLETCGIMVLLIGAASLLTGCPWIDQGVVLFKDKALESAIRAELGQPFLLLTRNDLLKLYRLDARGLRISSLEGLQYCENLMFLNLDNNNLTDLHPLRNLRKLQTLILDTNDIIDISPLANLLELHTLSLFDNQVTDIQALVTNARNGGLGPGDQVILDVRTLGSRAREIDVPTLQNTYGVDVVLVTERQN